MFYLFDPNIMIFANKFTFCFKIYLCGVQNSKCSVFNSQFSYKKHISCLLNQKICSYIFRRTMNELDRPAKIKIHPWTFFSSLYLHSSLGCEEKSCTRKLKLLFYIKIKLCRCCRTLWMQLRNKNKYID